MSLEVSHLTVTLAGRRVLEDVSFDLEPGVLTCLIGPNGAGKSTLLRAIAGLVPATGRVGFDGAELASLPARERALRLAYLPQGHIAHWPLPARDVVMLGRHAHAGGLGAQPALADAAAVDAALARVDAAGLAARPVTELSGGERARIMLARALAVEAPLLLADEPIAALDPRHQLDTLALLSALAAEGRTVIVALHDLALTSRFARRVLVLDAGRLVAQGAPAAVLTSKLLATVFGIEVVRLEHAGETVLVPLRSLPNPG